MSSTINDGVKQKIYDKYEVNDATSNALPESRTEGTGREYGVAKFAVRGNYSKPANCDPSRFTENDAVANYKIMHGGEEETDDSQGGKY